VRASKAILRDSSLGGVLRVIEAVAATWLKHLQQTVSDFVFSQ
jgi:hypothetical protein